MELGIRRSGPLVPAINAMPEESDAAEQVDE
jgi:hypothetical protein